MINELAHIIRKELAKAQPAPAESTNILTVAGGLCYAHGPYAGQGCPRWPKCATEPQPFKPQAEPNEPRAWPPPPTSYSDDLGDGVREQSAKPQAEPVVESPAPSGVREWPGASNNESFEHFVERIYDMTTRDKINWLKEDLHQFAKNYASHVAAPLQAQIAELQRPCRAEILHEELKTAEQQIATLTYKSTQHTDCAMCGADKHTPLRRDDLGGYVCLSCIDKQLSEQTTDIEGYEQQVASLTKERDEAQDEAQENWQSIRRLKMEAHQYCMCRETVQSLLIEASGTPKHSSDCATSIAPAEEPGICDCGHSETWKSRAEKAEAAQQVARADYWNGFHGFDVIEFDEQLVQSSNMSCSETVQKMYGTNALHLIEELLRIRH